MASEDDFLSDEEFARKLQDQVTLILTFVQFSVYTIIYRRKIWLIIEHSFYTCSPEMNKSLTVVGDNKGGAWFNGKQSKLSNYEMY